MSTLSQFSGGNGVAPKAIINRQSATSVAQFAGMNNLEIDSAKKVVTGALTANTLATVLSLTGSSGMVTWLRCYSVDATSRSHQVKVTIDGTVVFDATSTAASATGSGVQVIGDVSYIGLIPAGHSEQIPYNSSFLVEYASSVSETNKTTFSYKYRTN